MVTLPAAVRHVHDVDPRTLDRGVLEAMRADCVLWLVETDVDSEDETYRAVFDAYQRIDCALRERAIPSPVRERGPHSPV